MNSKPSQAVILCGGLGSRLSPFTETLPKPMIPCNGKPFLWHLLLNIKKQGVTNFLILNGYLGEKIEGYFGDGSNLGLSIQYSNKPKDWDTTKRIYTAKDKLDECFLLFYADNLVPFPLQKMYEQHLKTNLPLTLMLSKKEPGNIGINTDGQIDVYDKKRSESLKHVEIGHMIVNRDEVFKYFSNQEGSFSEVIEQMAKEGRVGGWVQRDSYHSVSDLDRWKKTKLYTKPKNIILLDRDGVINKKQEVGKHVRSWNDFEFIKDTIDALKELSRKGFKFIIISNQAGIKRKLVDVNDLENIHNNMTSVLLNEGIEILDIYYCPHFFDDYCNCRKPEPGMFYNVSSDWFIKLDETLYIGDAISDIRAAYNAGTKSIFLGEREELEDLSESEMPIKISKNLTECIPIILKYFTKDY
tara:strand:- start:2349 stop:3587 length:1239 start_codon:yes stop_codon:yes gene_type:complete